MMTMIVWRYGKKWQIGLYLLISIFSSISNVGNAWITTRFFTAATTRNTSLFMSSVELGLGIFVSWGVAQWLLKTMRAVIVRTVNLRVKTLLIQYLVDDAPLTTNSGQSISLMTNDLKLLETNGILNELFILRDMLTFVGALIGAFYLDWFISLAFFIGNLLPMGISSLMQKTISRASQHWSQANAAWTGQLKDFLAGLDTARAYQANGAVKKRTGTLAKTLENRLFHMNFLIGTVSASGLTALMVLGVLLPYGLGMGRVIQGTLTLASFMGIVQLSNDLRNPLLDALDAYNQRNAAKPVLNRIRMAEKSMATATDAGQALPQTAANSLLIEHATVKIANRTILHDITLHITPGEKVLLMAPSGFGKSTLLRVLQGEIPLASGTYSVAGIPANTVNRVALRQHFGLVKQTPFLFNDTLRYNITLGAEFSDAAVMTAVQTAGLSTLVADKGLDYQVVENGQNLSGGQIQRIEIARALLRQRPVLLADEATSALDDQLADKVRREFLSGPETLIEVGHQVPAAIQAQYDRVIHLDQLSAQSA
ncbi:ABC transporter ATP-binding protein [Schleiferilactobacillus harbinensis]|uniref:ABC transporter ATP-binding protein n=1 Tax=Schleiferilactobacillus harbinensis TaxID=304207 RepID=UPI0016499DAD|nr:ABC transporter ATP-binding protein [Schleiferilactobacillus harbinensis]